MHGLLERKSCCGLYRQDRCACNGGAGFADHEWALFVARKCSRRGHCGASGSDLAADTGEVMAVKRAVEDVEKAAPGGVDPALGSGFLWLRGYLDDVAQSRLLLDVRAVMAAAPLFTPTMPRTGKLFSVAMTNAGDLGWVSDVHGYRYQAHHPDTGAPWPAIPTELLHLWDEVAPDAATPEACLVNVYRGPAKLGSHVDRDEETFDAPVVSVSLGDDAVFHIGGLRRSDPKVRLTLRSGDVLVMGGAARLAYHGIDRVIAGTSDLLGPDGGRINLTLRRVTV